MGDPMDKLGVTQGKVQEKFKQITGSKLDNAALSFNASKAKAGMDTVKAGLGKISLIAGYNNVDSITKVMIILMGFIFFTIFFWLYTKLSLDDKNCKEITNLYTEFPLITSINPRNPIYLYKLRDYYIKTAYNCCSAGIFKNDFVNVCALKSCLKQGVRCLDFEIYSVNHVPSIAVSSRTNFSEKGSYNTVLFSDAMQIIATYAFSGNTCPNPDDPLILNFRIMSANIKIPDQMAAILYDTMEDRLLGKKFSYENRGINLGDYQLSRLMGKVVIMVDKSNPLFTSSALYEYVNIAGNAPFLRSLRYSDLLYSPDTKELTGFNKQNMSIVLPNLSSKNTNYSPALAMSYGCQMIGMCFQNFDANLEYYSQIFDDAGSAFVLKEEKYRYIPIFIPIPQVNPPSWSYAPRKTSFLPGEPLLTFNT